MQPLGRNHTFITDPKHLLPLFSHVFTIINNIVQALRRATESQTAKESKNNLRTKATAAILRIIIHNNIILNTACNI